MCRHWMPVPNSPGLCRKSTPTVTSHLIPGPGGQPQQVTLTAWPSTQPNDWCSEYATGISQMHGDSMPIKYRS
jgi:hypothetical protein